MSPNPWRQTPAAPLTTSHLPSLRAAPCIHPSKPRTFYSLCPNMFFPVPHPPPPPSIHPPPSARVSPVHSQHFLGDSFLTHQHWIICPEQVLQELPTTPSPQASDAHFDHMLYSACLLVCHPQQTVSSKMARTPCTAQHSTWHTGGME